MNENLPCGGRNVSKSVHEPDGAAAQAGGQASRPCVAG